MITFQRSSEVWDEIWDARREGGGGAGGGYGSGKMDVGRVTALTVRDSGELHREAPIQRTAATAPVRRGGGGLAEESATQPGNTTVLKDEGQHEKQGSL